MPFQDGGTILAELQDIVKPLILGALVDLDGVLLDTERAKYEALRDILAEFDVHLTPQQYGQHYGGLGGIDIQNKLIRNYQHLQATGGPEIWNRRRKRLDEILENGTPVFPYAAEALDFFRQNGVYIAAATSAGDTETHLKLTNTGLLALFDHVVTGDQVKAKKPAPDIYNRARTLLGFEVGNCIAFEDMQTGVESAVAAGISCVAIPNDFSKHQDFSKAVYVAQTLQDAVAYVREHYITPQFIAQLVSR